MCCASIAAANFAASGDDAPKSRVSPGSSFKLKTYNAAPGFGRTAFQSPIRTAIP